MYSHYLKLWRHQLHPTRSQLCLAQYLHTVCMVARILSVRPNGLLDRTSTLRQFSSTQASNVVKADKLQTDYVAHRCIDCIRFEFEAGLRELVNTDESP